MWRRKQQRSPPSYEDVRRVAEVLSRINAALIEKHFAVTQATAQEFMERIVKEGHFDQRADGWHYPLTQRQRLRRSHGKRRAAGRPKPAEAIAIEPASVEDLMQSHRRS